MREDELKTTKASPKHTPQHPFNSKHAEPGSRDPPNRALPTCTHPPTGFPGCRFPHSPISPMPAPAPGGGRRAPSSPGRPGAVGLGPGLAAPQQHGAGCRGCPAGPGRPGGGCRGRAEPPLKPGSSPGRLRDHSRHGARPGNGRGWIRVRREPVTGPRRKSPISGQRELTLCPFLVLGLSVWIGFVLFGFRWWWFLCLFCFVFNVYIPIRHEFS